MEAKFVSVPPPPPPEDMVQITMTKVDACTLRAQMISINGFDPIKHTKLQELNAAL